MIYIVPTKRGLGVEIWAPYDDMYNFREVIGKFWNDEKMASFKGYENRDSLISSLSYEIRKAYEGSRMTRNNGHFSFEQIKHYGFKISWVHILFCLAALRFNMNGYETTKFDIATFYQIEFWLEKAMLDYDEIGGRQLIGFIEDGLYGGNELIYQYMRSVNLDYYILGGGKRAYRKLADLLRRGIFLTKEYKDYKTYLEAEAKRLGCPVENLELDDDNINYEKIKW